MRRSAQLASPITPNGSYSDFSPFWRFEMVDRLAKRQTRLLMPGSTVVHSNYVTMRAAAIQVFNSLSYQELLELDQQHFPEFYI